MSALLPTFRNTPNPNLSVSGIIIVVDSGRRQQREAGHVVWNDTPQRLSNLRYIVMR